METYQELYINEVRQIQITVNDQDGNPFTNFTATATVLNSAGGTVVAETAGTVNENTISTTINQTTTRRTGKYKIVWKISKSVHVYYHVMELSVIEL